MNEHEMMRRKRRAARMRKKRRQRRILFGAMIISILLIVLITVCMISISNKKKTEKERAEKEAEMKAQQELLLQKESNAKELLNNLYKLTLETEEDILFAEWFFETYEEDIQTKLLERAEDNELTEAEIYEITGESLYVLSDRYCGLLADEQTAASNQIYIKEGKERNQISISIAGDLCLTEDGFVIDHYDKVNGLKECISPEILEITNGTDLFYVNHEYTISDRGTPLKGKFYTFRAKPERMSILQEMGTDIVSLANNHVYDYGPDALYDTADLLEKAGIPYVGGGRNIEEAKRPVYMIVNGIKIGFVGASNGERNKYTPQATESTPGILRAYDTTEYNEVIQNASKECDYLIAYIHWGTEDSNYLNEDQQRWGREFLASGADIVIGGHPHVLQGIEYVDGKPIIYSLGDFWFNHETKYTGLLKLNINLDGLQEMSFVPCLQTGFTTQYLSEPEKQQKLYEFLEELSPNIKIDENGVISES